MPFFRHNLSKIDQCEAVPKITRRDRCHICVLEMYFPPAFFDVMVHLCVHIVDDIIDLGPTFLHSMMPFERMNGFLKGFVHNMSHPDANIVQGYLTHECICCCETYLG